MVSRVIKPMNAVAVEYTFSIDFISIPLNLAIHPKISIIGMGNHHRTGTHR